MAVDAVERELIPDNPSTGVRQKADESSPGDARMVADPGRVARLLTAVTYIGRRNQAPGAHLAVFSRGGPACGGPGATGR
ncbi:hypothetical protein GCM10018963_19420 [Saccharothrix longispora]|uniref:hypothetical protein n=1 Tax=Saccharothrix longispora TaxID=33920 RepID=UPI00338C2659